MSEEAEQLITKRVNELCWVNNDDEDEEVGVKEMVGRKEVATAMERTGNFGYSKMRSFKLVPPKR